MYRHGIDMVENVSGWRKEPARAGHVIFDAPEFSVDGQGFFVEDMILVTHAGYEILNPALPYAPRDLERALAKRRGPR